MMFDQVGVGSAYYFDRTMHLTQALVDGEKARLVGLDQEK